MGLLPLLPFSNPEQIDSTTEYGAEWAARLEPTERTAGFAMIDPDGRYETLVDPETGALVVRKADGLLAATIPQRLPNFGPLVEVIFDRPITDGRFYPAQGQLLGIELGLSRLWTWVVGITDCPLVG